MNIVITGASSGLGYALALEYAKEGNNLLLIARNEERLKKCRSACRKLGANVEIMIADVKDKKQMHDILTRFDIGYPVDLVIANAGISAGTGGVSESEKQVANIMDTNVGGVLNSVYPLIPSMQRRGKGQIAMMSSLAGIRGLPSSPAYSSSKACVRFLGEGLRGNLNKYGIKVNVICPGYIKTPMTDANNFPMPFIMSAPKAAKKIRYALENNKSRYAFPLPMYLLILLLSILPLWITDPIFARLPAKKKAD